MNGSNRHSNCNALFGTAFRSGRKVNLSKGRRSFKNFASEKAHNALKTLVSDEKIQGNPSKSKSLFRALKRVNAGLTGKSKNIQRVARIARRRPLVYPPFRIGDGLPQARRGGVPGP